MERSLFWRSWALLVWLSVSVTSAALHLVLIASELITPESVKQCCQTSPAQPCFHSILHTPAGQMEASEDEWCVENRACGYEVTLLSFCLVPLWANLGQVTVGSDDVILTEKYKI